MNKLRFALPKGSLNDESRWSTEALLLQAGFDIRGYSPSSRNYSPSIANDQELEAIVDRPQNMPAELRDGVIDLAILGSDIAEEWRLAGVTLERVCDLEYGNADLVVAIPDASQAKDFGSYLREMKTKEVLRCATEYPLVVQDRIETDETFRSIFGGGKPIIVNKYGQFGDNFRMMIIESYGATESAVNPKKSADFIVETSQSGGSLRENSLRPIETWIRSSAGLYTTEEILKDRWKREKINYVRELLEGVNNANRTDYLNFKLPIGREQEMLDYLKRQNLYSKFPTITRNAQYSQIGIEIVKARWLEVLTALKQYGAEDIKRFKPTLIID